MNLRQNNQTAQRSLILMNIFLLTIHASLLVFFAAIGVGLMAFVNVFSVLFYTLSFFILSKNKITVYIFATFLEIMLHMFLAVISTGWNMGFQLYFIACVAIVYYADYFSVRMGQRHIKGIGFSIVSGALYLTSLLVTRLMGSLYNLGEALELTGLVLNSVAVFGFVTVFFGMQTRLAAFYEEELGRQATHDKLTGMVNRHFLVEQLEEIYAKHDMASSWIAILDIDNFKGINDKYGHLCGDFVLRTMSELIKQICGDRTVCRWGGEEFVIVGSDSASDENGRQTEGAILEDIRRTVAIKDFVYDEKTTINLTVTIGVARYQEGQSVDEWVNVADARLYKGKQTGKNKVVETD